MSDDNSFYLKDLWGLNEIIWKAQYDFRHLIVSLLKCTMFIIIEVILGELWVVPSNLKGFRWCLTKASHMKVFNG